MTVLRRVRVRPLVLALVPAGLVGVTAARAMPAPELRQVAPAARPAPTRLTSAPGFPAPPPAVSAYRAPTVLTIGRLHYEGGGDWYANPSSLPNLLKAIHERTGMRVTPQEKVVTLAGDELWTVPYIYMTGHGNVKFSEQDLAILRRYLLQGGFLHADDNYGMDQSLRREVARLFPDRPFVEVPLSHPIYHLVYDLPKGIPKIHEHDGKPAQGYGVFIDGRLVLYYSYQSDLGDGWEDFEVHRDPPEKHEAALRMGVNLYAYAVGFGGG